MLWLAQSGQIMVIYHHCAVPGPPRAASWPHGLRDGRNRYFPPHFRKSKRLGVVPRVIKELWDVPPYSPTCILYITILIWAHHIPLPSDTIAREGPQPTRRHHSKTISLTTVAYTERANYTSGRAPSMRWPGSQGGASKVVPSPNGAPKRALPCALPTLTRVCDGIA